MTENERIRVLRGELGLTLVQLGEVLGITAAAVSSIETGKSSVTDRTRSAIVREFGVSELWLRTGEGEIFPPKTRAEELAAFFHVLEGDPDGIKARLVSALAALDESEWAAIASVAEKLAEKEKSRDS